MAEREAIPLYRTLTARALLTLLISVVVAAALAFTLFSPSFERTLDEQLRRRGDTVVTVLAQHQELRLALALKNGQQADALAKSLAEGDVDVRFIAFLTANNKVLAGATGARSQSISLADRVSALPDGEQVRPGLRVAKAADGSLIFIQEIRKQDGGESELLGGGDEKGTVLGKVVLSLAPDAPREQLQRQTWWTILLTAGVLLLVFIVYFNRIAQRVNRIGAIAAQVASGDLTQFDGETGVDEIGQLSRSLDQMIRRTSEVVGRMQGASESLARASGEVLSSSSQQSQAASRQASSVAETGATVAELRETFNQAAERAQAVIDLAQKTEESTSIGTTAVKESVSSMERIREQVHATSKSIVGLVERTTQIGVIIDSVNDLAEQSNVLALNAAIEAARAGDQGRGFGVVAREVRSLAERSKDFTAQVRTILQDIERASRETMGLIEEGTRRAQTGLELSLKAGKSITTLDGAINQSSTAAKQIAASSRQQAAGVDQIWQAMKEIDRTVNESASGIRQLEQASKNMKTLSDEMTALVIQYRVARK